MNTNLGFKENEKLKGVMIGIGEAMKQGHGACGENEVFKSWKGV